MIKIKQLLKSRRLKKKKNKSKYVGKELKIKMLDGTEFEGLCTRASIVDSGEQVFLKLIKRGFLKSKYVCLCFISSHDVNIPASTLNAVMPSDAAYQESLLI